MSASLETMHAGESAAERAPEIAPRTWLLLGDKRGDNGQVEAITAALGWPLQRYTMSWVKPYDVAKPAVRATLDHVNREASDRFGPPWPDLIITVGRRPSMVAAWIKEQSGGHTRLVLFGKPSGLVEHFDLIVATGESQMPPMDNVVMIPMPLMRVDEEEIRRDSEHWRDRLQDLPRPLIGIFVGGPTGPYFYDEGLAARFLAYGRQTIENTGGTPYFVTSRRTPKELTARLAAGLPEQAKLSAWDPTNPENPYKALLGHADGFVVTGDSISMMVEIARLRRPLKIFPLPLTALAKLDQLRRRLTVRVFAHDLHDNHQAVWRRRLARTLFKLNILHQTRDFEAFQQMLIKRGMATGLEGAFVSPTAVLEDGAAKAARRIARMMGATVTAPEPQPRRP
ncbi:MAG: ELM1/GtrOC1 family putative glycosyltransferase [Pseudomonadota bacterium]